MCQIQHGSRGANLVIEIITVILLKFSSGDRVRALCETYRMNLADTSAKHLENMALSSWWLPQLASDHIVIDVVAGGYNNVQNENNSSERSTDCPPTNYGSCWSSF